MNLQLMHRNDPWRSSARTFCVAMTAVCLMFMATASNAACGSRGGTGPSAAASLAILANSTAAPSAHGNSIVGLWHVTYSMPDGTFYYESYDTWHSDGTEWESSNLSPLIGNICEGVWKQTGSAIHLNHVGWGFDNYGNPLGPISLIEDLVLGNKGNSYSGTFDFKQYDMNGNVLQEVTGTLTATRIVAN